MNQVIHQKNTPKLHFQSFNNRWRFCPLRTITKIYDGTHQTPNYVDKGVPFYSVEHVTANNFENTNFVSEEVFKKESIRVVIEPGDILMTRIGDIGTTKYIDWSVRASFYVSLALIKNTDKFNSKYLNQYLNTAKFRHELWRRTIHVAFPKKINLGEIGECVVGLPDEDEQQKIADFLTAVDEKIESLQKKVKLLKKYKKGVMQKIFSQKIRFKDENGKDYPNWEYVRASEVFKNVSNKNHNSDLPVLSVTQDQGIVERNSLERRIDYSDDGLKNYKVIEPGDFVISLRSFQGGIEMSTIKGISSPAYTVLKPINKIDPRFYMPHFKREAFISQLDAAVVGIRDGKQISYEVFADIKIPFPCFEEQKRIADFLSDLDEKIKIEERRLEQAKLFKKSLLQQMFV